MPKMSVHNSLDWVTGSLMDTSVFLKEVSAVRSTSTHKMDAPASTTHESVVIGNSQWNNARGKKRNVDTNCTTHE